MDRGRAPIGNPKDEIERALAQIVGLYFGASDVQIAIDASRGSYGSARG